MINMRRNVESTVNDHDYIAPKWMKKSIKPKIGKKPSYLKSI